ncbi:MAG: head GIN domain-containing protein [Chitinophagales bacterium]
MRKYIVLLLVVPLFLSSCRYMWGKRMAGNGVIKTEERSVSDFKNVEVSGDFKVYVSQGPVQPVKLEGDENLLSLIEVTQSGDRLEVRPKQGFNLKPSGELKVYVTAPVYNEIEVSGSCDIIGLTKINNAENLSLSASGAGNIKMDVDAPKLSAEISGAGSIVLKGQTKDANLELSGAGEAHCFDLLSESTTVSISGAGSADVYASVKLDAEVSGAGSVNYKGNAAEVKQHVSGAGTVSKVN